MICDVDIYGGADGYAHTPIMAPLRNAILSADAVFMTTPQMKTGFKTFLGSQQEGDASLTGKGKQFTFEIGGLGEWDIDEMEKCFFVSEKARNEGRASYIVNLAYAKSLVSYKQVYNNRL